MNNKITINTILVRTKKKKVFVVKIGIIDVNKIKVVDTFLIEDNVKLSVSKETFEQYDIRYFKHKKTIRFKTFEELLNLTQ